MGSYYSLNDILAWEMGQATAPAAPVPAPAPTPPPVPTAEIARAALEAIVRPSGQPLDSPATYSRYVLYTIRDEAVRRGAPVADATQAVRQEVWRQVLRVDPNPGADLDELAMRFAPPPPPPVVYAAPYAPAPAPEPAQRRGERSGRGRRGGVPTWVMIVGAAVVGAVVVSAIRK
jgi:hypothetical protein